MEIKVEKITDESLMQWACSMTIDQASSATLDSIYRCEHSPMRTQMFKVEMNDIPTYVSVHFVRHPQGVVPFVKSNRSDRCGRGKVIDRDSPVNHGMIINAQALINIARKRLCMQADHKTRNVMLALKKAIGEVDPALEKYMVPECEYRRGCNELKPCGYWEGVDSSDEVSKYAI